MAVSHRQPALARRTGRQVVLSRVRAGVDALEQLAGGLSTAVPALLVLMWVILVGLMCAVGVGVPLARTVPRAVRGVADRERLRLSRCGPEIVKPGPAPDRVRAVLAERVAQRELLWLLTHGTLGLFLSVAAAMLTLGCLQDLTFPLWWRLLPPGEAGSPTLVLWEVCDQSDALAVSLFGAGMGAAMVTLGPAMARLQASPGRRLLPPPDALDPSPRIMELAASRAAALDAHATELQRIERSLHDGAQNRLVAVTVLLGATRRALSRDPSGADAMLERAQGAAERALAELRTVARGILPPVLTDRGLTGALAGLAADCGVRCRVDVDVSGRYAASVEATAYFATAEALTNIVKHSGARNAAVVVRDLGGRLFLWIEDDGGGGADEGAGSGIRGIRSRIEAHDGRLTVTSPPGGPTIMHVELPCGL